MFFLPIKPRLATRPGFRLTRYYLVRFGSDVLGNDANGAPWRIRALTLLLISETRSWVRLTVSTRL